MTFKSESKIKAIITLMDFSLIIPEDAKIQIKEEIHSYSDEDIMSLGKILSFEHENREKLDKLALEDFVKSINKTLGKHKKD